MLKFTKGLFAYFPVLRANLKAKVFAFDERPFQSLGEQTVKLLRTKAEILAFKAEADRLRNSDIDSFVRFVNNARMVPVLPPRDLNPRETKYKQWVLDQYAAACGREYHVSHEAHTFDESRLVDTPYPYNTGAPQEIGNQIMSIGAVIKAINARPKERVLELGIGWGNLAIQLARYGVHVEGIDIEEKYARVVATQAARAKVVVPVHIGDFLETTRSIPDASFDVVLFYESFHHSLDHVALLRECRRIISRPNGRLVLAGETIDPNLEYPWGLNPGGIAIWTVATHGWLELAMREDYLLETLWLEGFVPSRIDGPSAASICYVSTLANKKNDLPLIFKWSDGFFDLEGNSEVNWRWCPTEGQLVLLSRKKTRVKLQMEFATGYPEQATLTIKGDFLNEKLNVNNVATAYYKELVVPPGNNVIKFKCDAKRLNASSDSRYLVFRVNNFKISEI
jgi:2-polyprenyl-3-methyl-5-hydroxy-6-metoxy-1,4-benzoquinol methylase